jgi:hypothetical protein
MQEMRCVHPCRGALPPLTRLRAAEATCLACGSVASLAACCLLPILLMNPGKQSAE